MNRSSNKSKIYNCITANYASAIWQHAAHTTDQLLLVAKQEPCKKSLSFTGKVRETFKKRYMVGRSRKSEIRLEEESEKVKSLQCLHDNVFAK